jgi:aspartyl-tRNA(Asn)/glutamyl-tRNA(Gln) amidotransferase subunit C
MSSDYMKDVEKTAKLARLALSDEEKQRFAGQFGSILGWMEQLNEVDTDGVQPMMSTIDANVTLREDVVNDGGYPDKVLGNAPENTQGFYTVPKVVE